MALTRPTLLFEVSYGTDAWDTPSWVDETQYLRSFKCKYGRQHELQAFDAGTSTLVILNNNRRFDPTWVAGPHGGQLLPGVRYRIQATWDAILYPVLHQWAERWVPQRVRPAWSNTKLTGVDSFKRLRKKKLNTPSFRDTVLADVPLAYYRFNETQGVVAVDSSGNGHDATYAPGTYGASNAGAAPVDGALLTDIDKAMDTGSVYDSALAVWRSQRYAEMPTGAALTGAGALSVGCLFRTIQTSGSDQFIFAQQDSGAVFEIAISEVGGKLHSFGPEHNFTSAAFINDGRWHIAELTRASNGKTWKLYLDGAQIATSTDAVAHSFVGPYPGFGGTFQMGGSFIGAIDEGAVYQGVELSAAQALEHYQRAQYFWPSEASGARIDRVLDNVGWPAGYRAIDTGSTTLQARLADLTGNSALDHAQLVEKSEAGLLYQFTDGDVVFIERNATLLPPFTVSQATFGDGPGELPYEPAPELWLGDDDIISEALGQRAGGEKQRSFDAVSDGKYGPSSQDLGSDLLLQTDADVKNRLDWTIGHYKDPAPRIGSLRIHPIDDPANLFPACLGLRVGDRVTVNGRPPGGGAMFSQQGIIESVEQEMTEDGDWFTTFEVGSADYVDYWILGVSALGISTRLSF